MSRHDSKVTLLQIQDAALKAQEICSEHASLESLLEDWKATAALERFIEIIGEAVKRLPLELRGEHPDIPWKEIAGTRDRLRWVRRFGLPGSLGRCSNRHSRSPPGNRTHVEKIPGFLDEVLPVTKPSLSKNQHNPIGRADDCPCFAFQATQDKQDGGPASPRLRRIRQDSGLKWRDSALRSSQSEEGSFHCRVQMNMSFKPKKRIGCQIPQGPQLIAP